MSPRPIRDNICAVVVTYHPDVDFFVRLQMLISQVRIVIIVDNGSSPASIAVLHKIVDQFDVKIIFNRDNLGIATALNQGVDVAQTHGAAWVLMLDQDSTVDCDMTLGLQSVYDQLEHKDDIGIIASNFRSRYGKYWRRLAAQECICVERDTTITSGSLLAVSAFCKTGRFRDDFFIDMVDTEYSLRLLENGYKLYMTTKPLMQHAIGAQTCHKFFGIGVIALNHSMLRRYYIARNRLVLARLYIRRHPKIIWNELRNMAIETIVIIIYEADKINKLGAILCGMLDAMRCRMGKKNNALEILT